MKGIKRLLGSALLIASASVSAEVLTMAADCWPPYTDRRLPQDGLSVDLIRTALGRAGYEVQYVEVPWERAVLGLQRGKYDLINDWHTVRHEDYARYSRPFMSNRVRWIKRRGDDIHYDGPESLRPYRIALSRGYAYSDELANDDQLNKGFATNFIQAARMLLADRVDLTLEDERTARFHFNRTLKDVSEGLSFVPGEFSERHLSLVVRNNHPQQAEIIEAFEREIALMVEDGTYAAIFRRQGLQVPKARPQP
ncbi:ABC transporter substrate-binding protein [Pseudomonas sp. DNDY-54]|uniref:substrate-binding periplasmic protein n=1 Tax=Pseudomonas sp. DNDY-54 TaxID=2870860 RepID=UPI0021AE203D|nr:transporter substrate-binding domain-containing protein [Pseudomonas sp. DNDY-54]